MMMRGEEEVIGGEHDQRAIADAEDTDAEESLHIAYLHSYIHPHAFILHNKLCLSGIRRPWAGETNET